MEYNINALREKEVIDVGNGKRIGFACDFLMDSCSGQLTALVLPVCGTFLGFGRKTEIIIPWKKIIRIGEDAILVESPPRAAGEDVCCDKKKKKLFSNQNFINP